MFGENNIPTPRIVPLGGGIKPLKNDGIVLRRNYAVLVLVTAWAFVRMLPKIIMAIWAEIVDCVQHYYFMHLSEHTRQRLALPDMFGLYHNRHYLQNLSLTWLAQQELAVIASYADVVTRDMVRQANSGDENAKDLLIHVQIDSYDVRLLNATALGNIAYCVKHLKASTAEIDGMQEHFIDISAQLIALKDNE